MASNPIPWIESSLSIIDSHVPQQHLFVVSETVEIPTQLTIAEQDRMSRARATFERER